MEMWRSSTHKILRPQHLTGGEKQTTSRTQGKTRKPGRNREEGAEGGGENVRVQVSMQVTRIMIVDHVVNVTDA